MSVPREAGPTPAQMAWVSRATEIALPELHLTRMRGATSSSVFEVRARSAGDPRRFVLRVLDNAEWLREEPDLAAHEVAALREARSAGLVAPSPVAHTDDAGSGAPALLMSFVEGQVEVRPRNAQRWLEGLATMLARIHRHRAEAFPWVFRSWTVGKALAPPSWTRVPAAWARAIDRWHAGAPDDPPVLLHRDYHAVNVLWRDGTVSGVVDWVNACRGPAGVDVAHCRTDLVLMRGPAAAAAFLEAYGAAAAGYVHDPYWDLDAVLDMCLPEPVFYEPWETFGLPRIPAETLRERLDAHLEAVLERG
ncbi:aminoglycoside phosphotransferase family protein [Chondromyces apiculatus]|uniref:Aminoglycoside phosphotransferase domain-containing protein n=1 Tax=Chondromyces apiculatus DSM 436 TaxID=1192034 RepID=A0A017T974_9BACT|nr:aminoglycoside phosphotransferase family protein [Chondromyces apiculatus]EYF05141.1 Hypothetical protein CAP_3506 [Chondromyces apiculatus DSM 436]